MKDKDIGQGKCVPFHMLAKQFLIVDLKFCALSQSSTNYRNYFFTVAHSVLCSVHSLHSYSTQSLLCQALCPRKALSPLSTILLKQSSQCMLKNHKPAEDIAFFNERNLFSLATYPKLFVSRISIEGNQYIFSHSYFEVRK